MCAFVWWVSFVNILVLYLALGGLCFVIVWSLLLVNWREVSGSWKWLGAFPLLVTGIWKDQNLDWVGVMIIYHIKSQCAPSAPSAAQNTLNLDGSNSDNHNSSVPSKSVSLEDPVKQLYSRQCRGLILSLIFYLSLVVYQSFFLWTFESVMWCVGFMVCLFVMVWFWWVNSKSL